MTPLDLEPATRRMAELIAGVPTELLDGPTPCPDYSLGDLVEHVGGLALAFTGAATKDTGGAGSQGTVGRRLAAPRRLADPDPDEPGRPGRSVARTRCVDRHDHGGRRRPAGRGRRPRRPGRAGDPRLGRRPGQRPGLPPGRAGARRRARVRGPVLRARAGVGAGGAFRAGRRRAGRRPPARPGDRPHRPQSRLVTPLQGPGPNRLCTVAPST